MLRLLPIAGIAAVSLGLTGCAANWDTLTSHRFLDGMVEHPWETTKRLWVPEDPVLVLRTEPPRDGDERADAMHRLKEPILNHWAQEDQDAIVEILGKAATSDPSPVVRMEAVNALGRFQDPRAIGLLMAAYRNAHGRRGPEPTPDQLVSPVGPNVPAVATSAGRAPTTGRLKPFDATRVPTGYQPEWVTAIRCLALDGLGNTNNPEAVRFLASVAGGAGSDVAPEGSEDRDIRLAAVRGLGKCRQAEAVIALNQVLSQATNMSPNLWDTAVIGRTHEGLVRLTGLKLPPDPAQWNEVVRAGVVIAPEPPWWQTSVEQAGAWWKQQ